MVDLAKLVDDSLTRHGLEPKLDHNRLQWSNWFRCEDSFSTILVPSKPGLFALADELPAVNGKRMLALFRISEADDLGMALGRLFLPGNREREHFAGGRCFARYAIIEEPEQRRAAYTALSRWMATAAEAASGAASGESNWESSQREIAMRETQAVGF